MSNILESIIADKKIEVAQKRKYIQEEAWEMFPTFESECRSLKYSLLKEGATGIIAEFKRKSPSKGFINENAKVEDIVDGYERFGASGVSILTDEIYFGGSNDDLINGRTILDIPILRKDFIIDTYQITEAKALGADVILLIAACLTKKQVKQFACKAHELGLEVLLEIHNDEELEHICDEVDLVGVNNRNLKTFEVSINTSLQLINKIPTDKAAVAESGISNVQTVLTLRQAGFKGFLIGENFMKETNPAKAFEDFTKQLKTL